MIGVGNRRSGFDYTVFGLPGQGAYKEAILDRTRISIGNDASALMGSVAVSRTGQRSQSIAVRDDFVTIECTNQATGRISCLSGHISPAIFDQAAIVGNANDATRVRYIHIVGGNGAGHVAVFDRR